MATGQQSLRLGHADHDHPLTAAEFAEADFAPPWRYERVAGRLVVMSPDSAEHDDCSEEFRDRLGAYKLEHPDRVDHVISESWVRIDGLVDRIADIAVYLATDGPVPKRPARVPDLVFEILSAGRASWERDYVEKRAEYGRIGVVEYVIVDRFKRTATVLRLTPDGYSESLLAETEDYSSPLLPGLSIPLIDALGEAD